MALTGQHSTYLERCVDSGISLPCDIQRILTTIRTLDERVEALKVDARTQCEQICQLPSAAARTATTEQIANVKDMREKMDHDHRLLAFLSTEKISFAVQAVNIVRNYISSISRELQEFDRDLESKRHLQGLYSINGIPGASQDLPAISLDGSFDTSAMDISLSHLLGSGPASETPSATSSLVDELQVAGSRQTGSMGGLHSRSASNRRSLDNPDGGPPRKTPRMLEPPASSNHLGDSRGSQQGGIRGHAHHRGAGMMLGGMGVADLKTQTAVPGDQVAACVTGQDEDGETTEWIMARVNRYIVPKNPSAEPVYEVKDEDASEGEQNMHMVPADRVVVLPKGNTTKDGVNLMAGSRVLAVYPRTSAFYLATVISPAKKYKNGDYGEYIVEFEDDGDGGEIPQRQVEFKHVVLHPFP